MTVDHRRVSSAVDGNGATTSAGVTTSSLNNNNNNNNKQSANIGSLRQNAFQWRNLYHHRYGIATYPPPVPRNPSTTTGTYPNVDAYMTLREQEANNTNAVRKSVASTVLDTVGSLVAAKNRSGSQDQATSDGLSPNLRQQARNALFTRSSFLIQRKAQLLLNKKREVEELRKQNPHALEQCILTIHQKAWTLLIDDSVTKATALEAKDYGDAAREMKERLQEQMRRNLMAMDGDSPFALDGPEDRSHSGNRGGGGGGGGGQEGVSPTSARSNSPGVLRHGDHALPSGATNPIHNSIAAERDRRLNLLSEFAPFFAVISPPTVVSAVHSQATPVYGRYALPVPGGSGDTVGLPLFSQYNTWEEACRQREAWPRAPFHFFMSRDVSFHHANVTAAVLMLETVARFLHRHRCIHLPQEQSIASDDPMRRRGTALGRSKSTVGITIGDPNNLLGATATAGGSNLPNIQGSSGDQPPPPPPQPEFWDGHRRVAPDTKCSTLFNPSSCPYLAMEQLTEDIIVVFEHAGARNALPMTLSMIRLFLDKALRPGLSTQLFGKTALLDVYFNDNTKDRDDLSASGSSGDEGGGTGHQRMRGGGGGAPFGASGSHAAAGLGGSLRTSGVPPALAHLLAPLSRTTSNSNNNTLRSSSLAGNQQQQPNSNNGTMPPPPRRPLDESSSSSSDDEDDTGGKRSVGGASLFSEREFHALFTLSLWFLDSSTATAVSAPIRSAAVAAAGNNRKKSRIAQPQAPKMAPGYTRIQNTARAPTLGIAEAVVRFEAARKIRIKAIRRRERQLHEEAQQKAIQYREDLEKERIREQDELRRRQIMAMHQVHNQHHQKSPNHSGGGGPMSSKENSFKGSSMGGHSGGHLGASNKSHTAVPPPSALHASVSQNSSSHSTSLHNNNNDVAESASLSRQKPRGDDPTSLKLVIPPQVVDSDDEVDFFVDVSKRSSKFGPMIQSTMLGDTATATTPRAVAGESPPSQFLVAPGGSAGGGPRGQRHTLLPHASSGGSSVLTRTTSPVAAIAVPTITHLAPPPASIAIPPTAEENAAAIRKLVLSLRCAVDDEMPAAATKLATPFIMMSSYMKLHGVGWCKDVCRSLLDYLSYPDIFLYVTDDDLVQPPMPCDDQRSPSQQRSGTGATPRAAHTAAANGKSPSNDPLGQPAGTNALGLLPPQRPHTTTINTSHRSNSEIGGGDQLTPFAQAASQSQRRASSYFTTMGPVVFSRAGSVATDSHQSPRNELTSTGVADPQETSSSRLSISMLGNQISPRAQPPQQWKFPIEDDAALETPGGGVKNLSVSTADPMSLPTNELSLRAGPIEGSTISPKAGGGGHTPQTSSHPQGGPAGLPFFTDGLDPAMTTFLNAMLRKESIIVEHIQKALEIWFETLEGSHASQKVPSGIAYLLTAVCASVHSHLLSGVVMTSALEVDGLEPDSIEFVEHLIATLVASTTPSASSSSTAASTSLPTPSQRTMASPGSPAMETQQRRASVASSAEGGGGGGVKLPAPPSGSSVPSSRRRATVILDPHDVAAKEQEPSPGLMVVPPTPAFSTRAGAAAPGEPQSPLTAAAAEASTAPPSPSPGANNSGTISLVSDVQTFRLAKFILFDVWLLPMLNNAQRYGLIPPHAPPHLIHNINAFVRYAKILVNAPYTQRNDERDKYKQQQEEQAAATAAAASMATSGGGAAQPVVVAEVPKQTLSDVDECVPPEYSAALRRSAIPGVISGVYNSSNGTLVQLFRFPQDFLMSQQASSSQNSGSGGNVADGIRKKSPLSASTPSNSRRRPSNNNQQSSSSRKNMTRAISTASARLGLSSGGESSMRKGGRVSSAAFLASSLNSTLMAASDYYVHQNGSVAFPTMAQLSPHLQQLNVAIGVATPSQMTVAVASALPQQRSPSTQPLSSQRSVGSTASSVAAPKSAAQQLEMFCWHASTDEDRHRVVPEFQVPPHIAVTCTENIYKVITGQHPATKVLCKHSNAAATKTGAFGRSPGPSNISPEETPMAQRLSVVSASSDGQSGAAAADGVVKVSKKDKSSEGEPSKDAVDLYLRCLHSVLLHPTTAGQALDCMSVNHRKLFQQLMRVPAAASHASTLGVSLTSDATSLACSLYPYLLVGVRDQPLVDVNAIAMLTSASLVTQSHIPLPSAFIQARRRLLARQLFLTTGARIGNFVNPAQSAATTNNNNAGIADDPSGDSPTHPTSPTRSSRRRSSRSITIGQPDIRPRGLGDDPEDGPIPQPLFAAWWCYMAAALCAKAECALEESSAFLSKRWERRCRQTMRRYSHRDSVAEATFSSNSNNNNAKTSRGGKGATKTTMKEKTKLLLPKLTSTVASKSHKDGAGDAASVASGGIGGGGGGGGGGLLAPTSRFGGGGTDASFDPPNTARRLSTSSTVVVRKNAGGSGINNPLMQRWREAVTDSVDRSEGDRGDTVSNSNSSRPSRAPSVSLETPRMVPRAPARQR